MKNKGIIIGIIVAVLVIGGVAGAVLLGGDDDTKTSTSQESSTTHEDMNAEGADGTAGSDDSSSADSVATTSVDIKDYAYAPATITVKVGDTVTWTNQDSVQHDVASDSSGSDVPNSKLLSKGESYKFTFTKASTYNIHCTPHPYMKQTIIVTE